MSANNQIQAENVSSLSLREASEKAVSALEGLLDHGKNAPWQAWEKALNANTFLRQALVAAEVDRHDAPDDVEVIYLVWAFQGHGSWTDATKEQYEKAKHDDRMAVVSLDAYLTKEQRTHPQPQAVAQGWMPIETAPKDGTMFLCWVKAERYSSPDGECSSYAHDTSQMDFCWWRDGLDGNGYFDPACGQIGDSQDVILWAPLPAVPGCASPAAPAAAQVAQPLTDQATIAGLESAVGHLSHLFDEQLAMLIQVEKELCVDGHYGPFEDGESQLCDRIRAHIAAHGIGKDPD